MTTQSTSTAGSREVPTSDSRLGSGDGDGDGVVTDAERLDCYRIGREMRAFVVPVLTAVSRAVRDQLDRASLSVVLNTAEGAGRFATRDKARFYSIARGSANETVALLDVVRAETGDGNGHAETVLSARRRAVRVIQMLVKLERRFGARGR